jgi:hypothetical protein
MRITFAIRRAFHEASRRLCRRARPAKAASLMMSMASVLLCQPEQARANQVKVMITGNVSAGTDYTGVFGDNPGVIGFNLAGKEFSLIYYFNDAFGVSCETAFSCIEYSPRYGTPLTQAILTLTGEGLPGNSPFQFGTPGVNIAEMAAYRWFTPANAYPLTIWFNDAEGYNSESSLGTAGSSLVVTAFAILNSNLSAIQPQPVPCWEGKLDYTVKKNDSQQNNYFNILVYEPNPTSPESLKVKDKANGALTITNIIVTPTQTPAEMCFQLH